MKKPFILFCGFAYYPAPGWQEYIGDFETLDAACEAGKKEIIIAMYDWWQVVDLNEKVIVAGEGEWYTGLEGPISGQS